MSIRFSIIVFVIFFVLISFQISYAYRPLTTEDAGVAGKGVAQLELSYDYIKWNGDMEHFLLLVPVYGITEKLEVSAEIPYLFHKVKEDDWASGTGDIMLVSKYLLFDEKNMFPAFTIKGAIKLSNGNYEKGFGSGDKDYSLFFVSSKEIKDLTIHMHLGYTLIGNQRDKEIRDHLHLYAVALDLKFTEKLNIVAEISGNRHPEKREQTHPVWALFGATYNVSEKLIIDLAVRRGITNAAFEWSTTLGFSMTF